MRRALDEALAQLEATWPINRSAHRFALADGVELEGECYAHLPLLPELAPCWVVTDSALLVGYRAAALTAARGLPAVSSAREAPAGTRMQMHLDRIRALDRRATEGDPEPTPGALYERLEIELSRVAPLRIAVRAALRRAGE
jgi:hypothetical protein